MIAADVCAGDVFALVERKRVLELSGVDIPGY